MNRLGFLLAGALVFVVAQSASADIIDDLNNATIIEEFLFDDAAGTGIPAAANNAGTGHLFDVDSGGGGDANVDVVTNGAGQLNASLKNNPDFGTNYVDNDDITTARVLTVMELTWDFNTAVFDPDEHEEVRLGLINGAPRGSQITAQFFMERLDVSTWNIRGSSGGSGTTIPGVDISPSQTTKFIAVTDANLDTDEYFIHFSADAGTSFTTIGPGTIQSDRTAQSMRMVLNNDLLGDNILIDRVYLAVIPEPGTMGLLVMGLATLMAGRGRRE